MSVIAALNTETNKELGRIVRGIVKTDEPMAKHTTFGIGGPADIFVQPADTADLAAVMAWVNRQQIPWFVFGDGANLLVADKGIRGVVIRMGKPFTKIEIDKERITAGSGAKLDKAVSVSVDAGLAGMENIAGIPGTIGGAIVMNAGTYRGEIGNVVELVRVVTDKGEQLELTPDDIQFKYRWSVFQTDKSKIITEAVLHLKPGDKDGLVQTAEDIRARRNVNLPTIGRSAGCMFKNPDGQSAGQLIDRAGLKGSHVGDAAVADKHGNFIMNMGSASAADIRALAEQVREKVKKEFDVDLIYEVRIVGDW